MSTAIGDLVVRMGCDNQQFLAALNTSGAKLDEFAGHTRQGGAALGEFGSHSEEAGGSIGGTSRAFGFLGRSIKEMGEGLGKQNEALGETVSSMGGATEGLGHLVHGYHALHTVLDTTIIKEGILKALQGPAGWVTIAAAAATAAGAYMYFASSSHESAEELKKLAEEQKKVRDEANHKIDSEMAHLREEIEKAKPPLEQFQDELAKSGRGAAEIARLTEEFRRLSAEAAGIKDAAAAAKDLAHAGFEQATQGFSQGSKFLAKFGLEHPNATADQHRQAAGFAHDMDADAAAKKRADDNKRINEQEQHAAESLRAQVENLADPLARDKELINQIRAGAASGMIGGGQAAAAEAAIQRRLQEQLAENQPKPAEQAKALEEGTDAAWKAILDAQNNREQEEAVKKTADNTQRIAELLQQMKDPSVTQIDLSY